jgi:hypothetical protein
LAQSDLVPLGLVGEANRVAVRRAAICAHWFALRRREARPLLHGCTHPTHSLFVAFWSGCRQPAVRLFNKLEDNGRGKYADADEPRAVLLDELHVRRRRTRSGRHGLRSCAAQRREELQGAQRCAWQRGSVNVSCSVHTALGFLDSPRRVSSRGAGAQHAGHYAQRRRPHSFAVEKSGPAY